MNQTMINNKYVWWFGIFAIPIFVIWLNTIMVIVDGNMLVPFGALWIACAYQIFDSYKKTKSICKNE